MNIGEIKEQYLQTKVQFVQTDHQGTVIESDETLFPLQQEDNIFQLHPFFESWQLAIHELPEGQEISLPCVHLELQGVTGIFDLHVVKTPQELAFTLYDFTEHYQYSQSLLQERNESVMNQQLLEAQNEAIRLQKEILDMRNEELRRQQGFKDQFLANMSHEIRTPLNAILGFANLLLKTSINQDQSQYLNAINMSGENLLVIINDILDFSKVAAGKLNINEVRFELNKLIVNLQNNYGIKALQKNLELKVEVDPDIPRFLVGDPIRLNQILTNLLENAFKFTDEGSIQLKAEVVSQMDRQLTLKFTVSDTGIGIDSKSQKKIFDSFAQAHDQIHIQYGGTGLGLAIVKKLVNLMHGKVKLESTPGKGALFSFTVVMKSAADQMPPRHQQEDLKSPLNKPEQSIRVLLAEDVPVNQLLAEKILNGFGYEVDVASDGRSALYQLQKNQYDLVLMDLQMPEMDGYETTRQIRQLEPPLKDIPIIALTAHAMQGEREQCLSVGMNDYVSKPFDPEVLWEKIQKLV